MSPHPELDELEASTPAAVEHARGCVQCAAELAWLRAEAGLFARRGAPEVAHLWAAVEGELGRQRRRRTVRRWTAAAACAAAAVALGIHRRPAPPPPPQEMVGEKESRALAALDEAEREARTAARQLETEYAQARSRLDPALARRWDASLSQARAQLEALPPQRFAQGELPQLDVRARLQLLDGYHGYLRSLRSVVETAEEENP